MKAKIALISAIIFALTSMYVAVSKAEADTTIKVYSERQPFLIKPLIDQYEQNSGNKIEWIFSKKGLVQKTILEKEENQSSHSSNSDSSSSSCNVYSCI